MPSERLTERERDRRAAIRRHQRPRMEVTRDDDGGITVNDPHSGVVLSVVSSHPDINGPVGLHVEAYVFESGDKRVHKEDIPAEALRNPRTTVSVFYALPMTDEEKAAAE